MSQEWYYSVGGDRQGPVSAQELRKLVDAGTLTAADLVWKDGMADWVPAKSIKGLFAAGASAAGTPAANKPTPTKTAEETPAGGAFADMAAEDDDRPSKKGRAVAKRDDDEDADDDRPRRKDRDDDDDDDRPRRKKSRGGRLPADIGSKKMTAGLLGILLGGWGVHKFYLGQTTPGILQIVITICTCFTGGIIGLIEGIIYLTKSDEDFYETYIVGKKAWF